jgi:hypothetical protein
MRMMTTKEEPVESEQVTKQKAGGRAPWVVPALAAVVTGLLWIFGVEPVMFGGGPNITGTLLSISFAANAGLVTYVASLRR